MLLQNLTFSVFGYTHFPRINTSAYLCKITDVNNQ